MRRNGKWLVLIGDVVASRAIVNRAKFQERLDQVLSAITGSNANLASPYTITLGDEFQAVFDRADNVFCDIVGIFGALHPARIRISLGVGKVTTPINNKQAIAMDGPAFYSARKGIERLRGSDGLIEIVGIIPAQEAIIRPALHLLTQMMSKWNRNRLVTLELLLKGRTVKEIACSLSVSEAAVYKTIRAGNLDTVRAFFVETEKAVNCALHART